MSEETVEIARRAYTAALKRPTPDFDTAFALFDRDHLIVPTTTTVEGRIFRGGDGFIEYLAEIDEAFDPWEATVVEAHELDSERVLVEMLHSGRSRGAAVPWEERAWYVATFREDRIVRTEVFRSRADALEAAAGSPSAD